MGRLDAESDAREASLRYSHGQLAQPAGQYLESVLLPSERWAEVYDGDVTDVGVQRY